MLTADPEHVAVWPWSALFKPGVLSGGTDLVTEPGEPHLDQLNVPALLNYLRISVSFQPSLGF